jgi:hypothetical protein
MLSWIGQVLFKFANTMSGTHIKMHRPEPNFTMGVDLAFASANRDPPPQLQKKVYS